MNIMPVVFIIYLVPDVSRGTRYDLAHVTIMPVITLLDD